MKLTIWDILTGLTLLGILCLVGAFGAILVNPAVSFNPFKPLAPVPTIAIPTATATDMGLPPTWTPTAIQGVSTQEVNVLPTLRPSSTPLPTATRVILPTFTPSKTVRITVVSGGGGGGGSTGSGVGGGSCSVIYQNPADDTVMDRGKTFTQRWTLKNTSSKSWDQYSVDIRFMSGDRLQTGADLRDMPYGVPPDKAVDILIDMQAPDARGTYTSNWALVEGSKALCRFYVIIKTQ